METFLVLLRFRCLFSHDRDFTRRRPSVAPTKVDGYLVSM